MDYDKIKDVPFAQRPKNQIVSCPMDGCQKKDQSLPIIQHMLTNHMSTKYMCPLSLPRHVVPITANKESNMKHHIRNEHPGANLEPIIIHARQINFKFLMPHKDSSYRTTVAELFLKEEREAAEKYLKEKNVAYDKKLWLTYDQLSPTGKILYGQSQVEEE